MSKTGIRYPNKLLLVCEIMSKTSRILKLERVSTLLILEKLTTIQMACSMQYIIKVSK